MRQREHEQIDPASRSAAAGVKLEGSERRGLRKWALGQYEDAIRTLI